VAGKERGWGAALPLAILMNEWWSENMISLIDSSTGALLSLALDAANLRQQAIANNIANVNTPGYRPLAVSFEERMEVERENLANGGKVTMASLADYQPQLYSSTATPSDDSGDVALDVEVAKLAGNTFHHQVLLKMLTKQFALLNLAINEGKR
jgi:flagellar basal-body rod protein FlgB